ncbi:hypothetical protein [Rhodobacter sp. 24-YEA-8]|uniref:hypothetical protein n=1 Tax=Rhodobacter sp. 24-YEA-8 TaxID=1884310 RepID=UPI00089C09F4|nr:hypothetical protein [Rhodobacter sp. 24-YEA-8]SEC61463.1 hypothetical protein SAMN05519105_2925 [Rhodobacter sp. 24-YEA-8]
MMRSLLLCALLLTAAGPAAAQEVSAPAPDELLALSFYVQQKDQASTEAELRRLQLKYPAWKPPADLSRLTVTGPSTEIDDMFRLIAAGQIDQARALIAATRAEFPSWEPPAAMTDLLATADGQMRFDAALAAGNLSQAISVASSVPGLLRCNRINNAWRIAEAQAAAGRAADAFGTYRSVAGTCVVTADLIATLEKADAVASEAEILALLSQVGQRLPAIDPELQTLRSRLLAGRGHDIAAPAGVVTAPVEPPAAGKTPKATPAPASSGEVVPARPVAKAPAVQGGSGGSGFQAAVAAGDWPRCLALSSGSRVTSVIYQRGWCAYNLNQPMEAVQSFKAALKAGLNAEQRRDAGYGLALAHLKMQMPEEASRIAASTDFTHKQRLDIERQILDQRGVNAYKNKRYKQAIAYFDALEQLGGGLRRDLAMLRAYSWLNLGDRAEARRQFQKLNSELSTDETRRGLRATSGG